MDSTQSMKKAQVPVVCGLCKRNSIQWKCVICSLSMCTGCNKCQKGFKNDHITVEIKSEAFEEKSVSFSAINEVECQKHSGQTWSLHCKTCKQFICIKCKELHRGHDFAEETQEIYRRPEKANENKRNRTALSKTRGQINNTAETDSAQAENVIPPELELPMMELKTKTTTEKKIEISRYFITSLKCHHCATLCSDGSLWIADSSSNVLQKIGFENDNIQVKLNIELDVFDIALFMHNNLLVSIGTTLKVVDGKTGKITDSNYNVSPLWPRGIHITEEYNPRYIIGAVLPNQASAFPTTGSVVIVKDQDGKYISEYEYDHREKTLFTYPYRIASTVNGNMHVIDRIDPNNDIGRVIVMELHTGKILQIFSGHPEINRSFKPTDILTTLSDKIIVTDSANEILHVLNNDGQFIIYFKTREIGIRRPYSLALARPGYFFIGCNSEDNRETANLYEIKYSGF
ncbi:unnamed protein product [Mytilus coruscus]|uniref:B box-type domain-containing protein n=1 Tax=Mytilus coruscus TaxID=42192 RepID=A0A6J8BIT9_MYTCO|nr:unnamed protein product [Mytilus coruscus]